MQTSLFCLAAKLQYIFKLFRIVCQITLKSKCKRRLYKFNICASLCWVVLDWTQQDLSTWILSDWCCSWGFSRFELLPTKYSVLFSPYLRLHRVPATTGMWRQRRCSNVLQEPLMMITKWYCLIKIVFCLVGCLMRLITYTHSLWCLW